MKDLELIATSACEADNSRPDFTTLSGKLGWELYIPETLGAISALPKVSDETIKAMLLSFSKASGGLNNSMRAALSTLVKCIGNENG